MKASDKEFLDGIIGRADLSKYKKILQGWHYRIMQLS
jgi:hypothetical protein